jgi:hypothetical protein
MRREPNSSRLKSNSSSRGSRYSRRLGFPVENIPGVEAVGRWRKRPADRSRLRSYRSCSCYRNCRNRSCRRRYSSRRRCSCRNRGNRDSNNCGNRRCESRANHGCGNRDWNSCASRCSNSWEPVDNLSSGLVDNLNLGPVDRRWLAGRQPGPGWQRWRGLGFDPLAQRRAASGQCCLGQICCILRMRK